VAEAGTTLSAGLVVELRDAYTNLVPGTSVTFSVTSGNGSVSSPQLSGSNGRATATAMLGTVAGVNSFTATAGSVSTTFTETATLTAYVMVLVSGDNQEKAPGTLLPQPLKVKITNIASLPVAGVVVNWLSTSGGGSVSSPQSTTNSSGEAQMTATMGPALGLNTFTAAVGSITGSPVTFVATGKFTLTPASVDLQISSGIIAIGAYQAVIHFDPSKVQLSASNVTGGNGAGFTGTPLTVNVDNFAGTLVINSFQTGANTKGNFTVAHLVFTPVHTGTVNLTISSPEIYDSSGSAAPGTVTMSLSATILTID